MSEAPLQLDTESLLKLERIAIAAKTRISGNRYGRRKSRQIGASLDFADYRLYAPGDDIRQIDWNAYGRSGKPFIKLFHDETELAVKLLLDVSASMSFGGESAFGSDGAAKLPYAKKLAACVGYMALAGYDRVSAATFGDASSEELPTLRGKASARRLFHFLENAAPAAAGTIGKALIQPGVVPRQRGMVWLFSDLLFESGLKESLNLLLGAKQEIVVVHILSPEELNPHLAGDLRLIDIESNTGKEVAVSGKVLQRYRDSLAEYIGDLRQFCHERGITYALAPTNVPVLEWLATTLRQTGVLQ